MPSAVNSNSLHRAARDREYVRGGAHTNTIEGHFRIFKHGMTGVYQHCYSAHPKRYLAELDFRYNQRVALGSPTWSGRRECYSGLPAKGLPIGSCPHPEKQRRVGEPTRARLLVSLESGGSGE